MTTYTLAPLETLPPPPTRQDLAEVIIWLALVAQAINELNSKITFVASSAGITIPASGG